MNGIELYNLPNKFFYFVAKEYLKYAYPKIHSCFLDFKIKRKKSSVTITCFKGGGWVYLTISLFNGEYRIKRTGNYALHKKVNSAHLIKKALEIIDEIKDYYSIKFQENIATDVRCVSDIESGKKEVIRQWNYTHSQSKIEEPINWIVTLV